MYWIYTLDTLTDMNILMVLIVVLEHYITYVLGDIAQQIARF